MRKELLVGCGNARFKLVYKDDHKEWDGLVTLDHSLACKPDVIHDLEKIPYPFEDNTFDEIHAYCVLEHTGRQGDYRFFFAQWEEFFRIIKHEGTFHALVPRHTSPWAWGDPSHTRIITIESLVFLDQTAYEEVGNSAMTDYRHCYKANWKLGACADFDTDRIAFILKAIKQ